MKRAAERKSPEQIQATIENITRNIEGWEGVEGESSWTCRCQNRGYIQGDTVIVKGREYPTVKPCPNCELGAAIEYAWCEKHGPMQLHEKRKSWFCRVCGVEKPRERRGDVVSG